VRGDPDALRAASEELEALSPETLVNGLTGHDDLTRLRERLRDLGEPGPRCITAFGALDRVEGLEATVGGLTRISSDDGWDVVLSLSTDPVEGGEGSPESARWSEGAVEELRSMLPAGHVVARQRRLRGSWIDPASPAGPRGAELRGSLPAGGGATAYLVAFGPRSGELCPVATFADAGT
jgi:hypothetical protein